MVTSLFGQRAPGLKLKGKSTPIRAPKRGLGPRDVTPKASFLVFLVWESAAVPADASVASTRPRHAAICSV